MGNIKTGKKGRSLRDVKLSPQSYEFLMALRRKKDLSIS